MLYFASPLEADLIFLSFSAVRTDTEYRYIFQFITCDIQIGTENRFIIFLYVAFHRLFMFWSFCKRLYMFS